VTLLERIARAPTAAVELANVVLTTDDAVVGATPREVVWTHRGVTLYRYRSSRRSYAVPLLLVFAAINRPTVFDLKPGGSLVEYLLEEGFDVFLLDWGVPGRTLMGLDDYVCDELHWGVRETLRASGADEVTLVGWCMGATLCAMYCGLEPSGDEGVAGAGAVRNLVLLTMPVDGRSSTYARWVGGDGFDAEWIAGAWRVIPARRSISPTSCSSRCRTSGPRTRGWRPVCSTAMRAATRTSRWPSG
jgi:polyhydroxyalkanoate synthase